jgi:DNA sulfur modification protein DndD
MKLKSARVRNFKLLRDVHLDLSLSSERPLTVVRAENGSGKTSALVALSWGLYGNDSLEDPSVRLSPTSWPDETECEISVQLDFSNTLYNEIAGEFVPTTTNYRLVRSATESPLGDLPNRGPERVSLYKLTGAGLERVDPPELEVERMLPAEMMNVFFTDGDAAMNFISPQLTRANKRDQVQDAIRSLLGLGLLEGAGDHISGVQKRFNAEVSRASQSPRLRVVGQRLENAKAERESAGLRLKDVERQIEELGRRHEDADKRLQIALQAGDHVELARQQESAKRQLRDAEESEGAFKVRHQQLLQDERLSLALLGRPLREGFVQLAMLHDAGVIPSGSVPVLEERLDLELCICGTSLAPGTSERLAVERLIAEQRTVDQERKALTELHHAAKVDLQRAARAASDWKNDLSSLERTRLNNQRAAAAAREQLRICEEKLSRIDEVNIDQCRKDRDSLRVSLNAKQDEHRDLQTRLDQLAMAIAELKPEYDRLRREDQKLEELNSRLTVTDDMLGVVEGAVEELQQKYLAQVSERMNALFLEMVGADPESMAEVAEGNIAERRVSHVFQSAAITEQYEIEVHTSEHRTLNPDHELNGASKRALTFSFIWALTEVSGIIAPRIIDTPLGMMSGALKKRVVELITTPSGSAKDIERQIVLFLTRDEIRGIEEVLDERAGRVVTFSNTDHYPVDLVNDPGVDEPLIMVCECNHRQYCPICARRNDELYKLTLRTAG